MTPLRSSSRSRVAIAVLLSFLVVLPVYAQKAKPGKKQTAAKSSGSNSETRPLIEWKGGEVSLGEFEAAYKRMNDRSAYETTLDSLKDFLNVYADYRLKLQQAREAGLDKDPKVLAEIEGYRKMLAGPFYLDKQITDPAVRRLYDRRREELHAAHFLAGVHNWNDPLDTLQGYNKALNAIKMLDAGYPMTYIAMSPADRAINSDNDRRVFNKNFKPDTTRMESWPGSDDPSSRKNGGDLGYFTGGMAVREFEDAAYALKPGEFTRVPVRTRFGYHVIYLYDRTPRTGGVHVKHILVMMPNINGVDTLPYYKKADSILTLLHNGANFEDLARRVSEDKFSAPRGGDFDTINHDTRRAELAFDRASYNLKDGEISGIVRTTFGYHIIKRVNGVAAKTFEQEKDDIRTFYKKYFFEDDKNAFMASLRKRLNLTIDSSGINYFVSHVDSSRTSADSGWSDRVTERQRTIFHIGDVNWTVGSLLDSLTQERGQPLARTYVYELIAKTIDNAAIANETRDMATKYPEFEKTMEDYKNGIILFDMENKRVWSKVVPDTAAERAYYQQHPAKFLWPERIDISEIFVTSDSLSKQLYKRIVAGENFDSLAAKYTERPGFKAKAGRWGLMTRDENELSRRAFTFVSEEVKEPFSFQGGFSIVKLNRRDPVHPKAFEEARQEVASAYQDERANDLRAEWVAELRKQYNRKINEDLVVAEWKKHHPAQTELLK
jgi:peptidyl-prolyl cis-trans isomerase SurA